MSLNRGIYEKCNYLVKAISNRFPNTPKMKATHLRLGNIVALIDQPENLGRVLILEPGLVHLMNRDQADDENNIIGVAVSKELLESFKIPINTWVLNGRAKIDISFKGGKEQITLQCAGTERPVYFLHEIQNKIFEFTGEELFKHKYVHYD
jgi:hypothetical protein